MLNDFWKHFKSGTDIRGVAMDGVDGQPLDMSDEVIEKIGAAFVVWLAKKSGKNADGLTVSVTAFGRTKTARSYRSCALYEP